jgi:hypothetical protein
MSGVLSSVVRSWQAFLSRAPALSETSLEFILESPGRHVIGYLGQDHSEFIAADAGDHAMPLKDFSQSFGD